MHNKKERTTIRSFNVILSFLVRRDAARRAVSLLPPLRETREPVPRLDITLGQEEIERFQIRRHHPLLDAEVVVGCLIGVIVHPSQTDEHLLCHAVGAPLAVGAGLFRRNSQHGQIRIHRMVFIDSGDVFWKLLLENLFIRKSSAIFG